MHFELARLYLVFAAILIAVMMGGGSYVSAQNNGKTQRVSGAVLRSNIEKRAKPIIAEQLRVDKSKLKPNVRFLEDLGADPLDLVEVFLALEEEFEIKFSDEDSEKLPRVRDVYDRIEQLLRTQNKKSK